MSRSRWTGRMYVLDDPTCCFSTAGDVWTATDNTSILRLLGRPFKSLYPPPSLSRDSGQTAPHRILAGTFLWTQTQSPSPPIPLDIAPLSQHPLSEFFLDPDLPLPSSWPRQVSWLEGTHLSLRWVLHRDPMLSASPALAAFIVHGCFNVLNSCLSVVCQTVRLYYRYIMLRLSCAHLSFIESKMLSMVVSLSYSKQ